MFVTTESSVESYGETFYPLGLFLQSTWVRSVTSVQYVCPSAERLEEREV